MLFSFHCPACKGKIEADASLSGSQSPCPHCAAPVAIPEPRVAAGTTLAGFRLERRLGKGGMGEVYLARQLSVERQVAVKILPPGFAENPQAVKRFLHEGKLAARLDHFNIVTVFEAGEDNGNFYLAMAYIEGESLDQRLERDKVLPEAEALAIARTVADALAYAWDEFQLLHRDLKPANIMIDRRGRVFLMDLGLAKSVGEESRMTLSGSVIGTPQYMSPEQAQGLTDLGVPTDVYALGATLYHLVTGAPPFTGETMLTVLHKHIYEALPPPRSRNPGLSEACGQLIETMMAKQPAARYRDWRALIADIDRVLKGAPPVAVGVAVPPSQPQADRPLAQGGPSRFVGPPSGGPVPAPVVSGIAAVPPAVGKADSAGEAPQALPPAPRAPPVRTAPERAAPAPRARPTWLSISLLAAVVVALALVGALVKARHGPAPARTGAGRQEPRPTVPASQTKPAAPPVVASTGPVPGQPWTVPEVGMEFVWIKQMNLWVGKYETTNGEYRKKEPLHDSKAYEGHNQNGDRQPVVFVDWDNACAYAEWLTERERAAGRLPAGLRYRLPTEDEFMVYAQCGDGREYPWGHEWPPKSGQAGNYSDEESAWKDRIAGYRDGHAVTCVVEESWANPWDLYGVGGNVWEGCANDTNTKPSFGGWRGACWGASPRDFLRCTCRFQYDASTRGPFIGFRLVLSPRLTAVAGAPPTLGQPWTVPDLGLELVWVAPGSFQMGVPPVHAVRISRGFWFGMYEVTQAEYEALTGTNPSGSRGARNPVDQVSRRDALAFCAKLTEREQKVGRLPQGYEYRLPTEAEWEYAARGGAKSQGFTYSGSNSVDEVAWYYGNSGDRPLDDSQYDVNKLASNNCRAHPVGLKKPNELGLYDVSGNAWEWCLDYFDESYYTKSPGTDPVNLKAGSLGVFRGGSWLNIAEYGGPAPRYAHTPELRGPDLGFRACLGPRIEGLSGDTAPALPPAKAEPAPAATTATTAAPPVLGRPWTVPDLGLELVWVAPGSFQMGSIYAAADGEARVHPVRISRAFWIGKYEVTQTEYEAVIGKNPSYLKGPRNPVDTVSWDDAVAFCAALTLRERAAGRLPAGYEYRLPTEAEWEYAARGGAGSKGYDYAGSNAVDEVAWYYGNSGDKPLDDSEADYNIRHRNIRSNNCRMHQVGQRKPNELGLYDMSGNAWEWCLDWYDAGYYGRSPNVDPVNTQATADRVNRGSAGFNAACAAVSAIRGSAKQGVTHQFSGFRACLGPTIPGATP